MSRSPGDSKSKSIRRRSLGAFTKLRDDSDALIQKPLKKRRSSIFQLDHLTNNDAKPSEDFTKDKPPNNDKSPNSSDPPREPASSWRLKKGSRPVSFLDSLKNLRSNDDDTPPQTASSSKTPSVHWREPGFLTDVNVLDKSAKVLHHGEVQNTGMLRKKREYLVLTETQLIRFKTQAKAAELFPDVPSPQGKVGQGIVHTPSLSTRTSSGLTAQGKSSHGNHASSSSIASKSETHSENHSDKAVFVPLEHVVAVYLSHTTKDVTSLELAIFDGYVAQGQLMSFLLAELDEAQLWAKSIRYAVNHVPSPSKALISDKLVEYAARAVEQQGDYHPSTFRIYKVVKRQIGKFKGRFSGDDLNKLNPSICFLVIGMYSVHLISLPKKEFRLSSTSLADANDPGPFGIMTLTAIKASDSDDCFSLTFRMPFQRSCRLHLASIASLDIGLRLKQVENFLRPLWTSRPCLFQIPSNINDDMVGDHDLPDDGHTVYDRTLIAYCRAYGVDSYNVRYAIQDDVGDAPRYRLYPSLLGREYSNLELLAIFRSLRYTESFASVSFAETCLDSLDIAYDHHGAEHAWPLEQTEKKSLLVQEVRALATTSTILRRMDFSSCVSGIHSGRTEGGSGLLEALYPLCTQQATNVDWVALNHIKFAGTDLDYFLSIAADRKSHFRAIEARECGLNEHSMHLLLDAFKANEYTLEAIDLSRNPLRLDPKLLPFQLNAFEHLKILDLSHLGVTGGNKGPDPLLPFETLRCWQLEELRLSDTPLNFSTAVAISSYVSSPQSRPLQELILRNCSLDGNAVALILESMVTYSKNPRPIHLDISGNPIREGHPKIAKAIARQFGPKILTMRYIDYLEDDLEEFLLAMVENNSIVDLDISRLGLPGEAGEGVCQAFAKLFSENTTLEALNMAGEDSRLEIWALGAGINSALEKLQYNRTLKVLEIQDQQLHQQGANTLAEVIRKNRSLQCLYCENNGIPLSGFTDLVDALSENQVLLYLPTFDESRMAHLWEVQKEIMSAQPTKPERSSILGSANSRILSVRKSLSQLGGNSRRNPAVPVVQSSFSQPNHDTGNLQDDETLNFIDTQWEIQVRRLYEYIDRNKQIAGGLPTVEVTDDNPGHMMLMRSAEEDEQAEGGRERPKQSAAGKRSSGGYRSIFGRVKEFGGPKEELDHGDGSENLDNTGSLGAVDIDVSPLMEGEIASVGRGVED